MARNRTAYAIPTRSDGDDSNARKGPTEAQTPMNLIPITLNYHPKLQRCDKRKTASIQMHTVASILMHSGNYYRKLLPPNPNSAAAASTGDEHAPPLWSTRVHAVVYD